ncbi:MAG: FAD-dependent oxidoreductase [Myxococcota bacterium]
MSRRVAVLGAGVAGLTAAHELVERGFEVTVYEARPGPGGKARSINVASGTGQLHPAAGAGPTLPGEHGFRFIPGFYRHVPDTMARIPFAGNRRGVLDNLVLTREIHIAPNGAPATRILAGFPTGLREMLQSARTVPDLLGLDVPANEWLYFADRLFQLLTSCPERRLAEYEGIPWWDFVNADKMSPAYQRYLCVGLTRTLVAMRAETASTRTIGNTFLQLVLHGLDAEGNLDRVLNGPTNEVWIDPWVTHLRSLGVRFVYDARVTRIACEGQRITSVAADIGGAPAVLDADWYLCALPLEGLLPLLNAPLVRAAPALGHLDKLHVSWMNGIQIYLREDVPLARGHSNLVDSPWALTAISQAQFWRRRPERYGTGEARGILSIDISNWDAPGMLTGRPARELDSAEQIFDEVLAQMRAAVGDLPGLRPENIVGWFLDPAIQVRGGPGANGPARLRGHGGSAVSNLEPLLINTVDSWRHRPEAVTPIENLFLAGDYVRTFTDLATMEGANESARRATNGLLAAAGVAAPRCAVWPLEEPRVFAPFQALDARRFRAGQPWRHPLALRGRAAGPTAEGRSAGTSADGRGVAPGV